MCLLHGVAFDRPSMAQTALLSALRSNKCASSGRIPLASSWACKGKRNSGVPKSGWCVTANAECYYGIQAAWVEDFFWYFTISVTPVISILYNIVSIAYDCSIDCSQLLRRLLDRLLPSKVGARASKSHWRKHSRRCSLCSRQRSCFCRMLNQSPGTTMSGQHMHLMRFPSQSKLIWIMLHVAVEFSFRTRYIAALLKAIATQTKPSCKAITNNNNTKNK